MMAMRNIERSSCAGAPPSSQARARARACATRSRWNPPGSLAIRSITLNAVDLEATAPNSAC